MKFKLITKILCCFMTVSLATSCQDFLEQENPNYLTATSFWTNLADCQQGLTAVYNSFKDETIYMTIEDSRRSDLAWTGANDTFPKTTNEFYIHTFNESTSALEKKWMALYRGIFRANQVITSLNNIKDGLTEEEDILKADQMMGQAVFFRALFHFYLYCTFNEGNVPIVTEVPASEAAYYRECSSRNAVQDFVRAEMTIAEELLPSKGSENDWGENEKGRVHSEAASTILGLTYLYENEPAYLDPEKRPNYAEAKKYFKKVIDNTAYALAGVDENFTSRGEFNSESILEISYTNEYNSDYTGEQRLTHGLSNKIAPKEVSGGAPQVVPAYWLYKLYGREPIEPKDQTNYVNLNIDYHGDIYYWNQEAYNNDLSLPTRLYSVVKMIGDIEAKNNLNVGGNYARKDLGAWADDNPNYFVLKKVVKVDTSTGALQDAFIDYQDLIDNASTASKGKNLYAIINNGTLTVPPARPFKNIRSDGYWTDELQVMKESDDSWCYPEDVAAADRKENTDMDDATNPNNDRRFYWRRPRSCSRRTSQSVVLATDEDTPYYQGFRALEVTSFKGWALFRKYTNWDTRTREGDGADYTSDINFRLLRLADVYLLYAETLIEGGANEAGVAEAIEYINKVRKRAGTVLIGYNDGLNPDCTYQSEYTDRDGNLNYDLYGLGGDFNSIVDSAKEVMDHLMYIERPLELSLEGHSIRFIDLRRWNIVKDRFTDLATHDISTHTFVYGWDKANVGKLLGHGLDYNPVCPDYEGLGTGPDSEYALTKDNYNDTKAYYPIPLKEVSANPSVVNIMPDAEAN